LFQPLRPQKWLSKPTPKLTFAVLEDDLSKMQTIQAQLDE